jgi:hypothetical protein
MKEQTVYSRRFTHYVNMLKAKGLIADLEDLAVKLKYDLRILDKIMEGERNVPKYVYHNLIVLFAIADTTIPLPPSPPKPPVDYQEAYIDLLKTQEHIITSLTNELVKIHITLKEILSRIK